MNRSNSIHILGGGAIGMALATHLQVHQRHVSLVRTSTTVAHEGLAHEGPVNVTVRNGQTGESATVPIHAGVLAHVDDLQGIVVVTAKSYANESLAAQLRTKHVESPIVIMQNGIGVEDAFLEAGFQHVYRTVLYATGQKSAEYDVSFRPITSSSIGLVKGDDKTLHWCVAQLHTPAFPFHSTENIQTEVWRKSIINAVFNAICPLLEVDNGVFARQPDVANFASDVIDECVQVADALGIQLDAKALMGQLLQISQGSDGQLISTMQDILQNRETEIESLNLAIARMAERLTPPVNIERTKLLGQLILLKSNLHRKS